MTSPTELFLPTHTALAQHLAAGQSAPSDQSHSSAPSDSLQSLQDRIAAWQQRTFPEQPLAGKLAHLVREARELRADPEDLQEWADVLILLLGAAAVRGLSVQDLRHVAELKFNIAQQRQWGPADSEGVHHHLG